MHIEKIDNLIAEAKKSISLKMQCAEEGHGWPTLSHTIGAYELLELAALAKTGRRIVEIAASERGGAVHAEQIEQVLARASKPLVVIQPDGRAHFVPEEAAGFDLLAHLRHQREWSEKTFGPGNRTKGVIDHILKELHEIEEDPDSVEEWVDVIILAFDGAWRAGWKPEAIIAAIAAKQKKNEGRQWPDWRTADPDKAIEHVRSEGGA